MSSRLVARKREHKTKELSLKQRVRNYLTENPKASRASITKHFNISSKELTIILGKLGLSN